MIPNPYLVGGVGLVFLMLFGGLYTEHLQVKSAKADAHAMQIDRDAAIAANGDLAQTVKQLQAANLQLASARAADQAAADKAVASLQASRDALQRAVDAARRNRTIIYAQDTQAAVWARQPVPAAVAAGLQ